MTAREDRLRPDRELALLQCLNRGSARLPALHEAATAVDPRATRAKVRADLRGLVERGAVDTIGDRWAIASELGLRPGQPGEGLP